MQRSFSVLVRDCLRYLAETIEVTSTQYFPIDVEQLARQLNVQVIEPAELKVDGYIGLTADGRVAIRYRQNNSRQRNRFTIAHELGHLIVAEVTGVPLSDRKMRTGYDPEEAVANRLAAEILIPESIFRALLQRNTPRWSSVQSLRRQFDVSASSLLRRITEISGIAAIFCRVDSDHGKEHGRRIHCDATSAPLISFPRPISDIVTEKLTDEESSFFSLKAFSPVGALNIPCELRHAIPGSAQSIWMYGWTPL